MAVLGSTCPKCKGYMRPITSSKFICDACDLPPPDLTLLTNPMSRLLREAETLVTGDRRASYGTPGENHGRTAKLWAAYLGREMTAHDVCMLNILQKISRLQHGSSRDNLVDIAGYAANAEELRIDAQGGPVPPLHK